MTIRLRLQLSALLIALCVPTLQAQVDAGSVQGQVTDAGGGIIRGAAVTLRNEGTGSVAKVKTNAHGDYTFSPVQIGNYSVTVEQGGFFSELRSHLRVDIQQKVQLDFALKPGEVKTTIDVTSTNNPLLQTDSSSVGQVIEAQQINDLPLNGRNYFFLAQLSAGVTTAQTDTRGEDSNGRFAANGARPTENDYLLDGIDNNSSINSIQNGKDYVIQTPIDALSEFKVQTNNYSAEFGRSAGAILNATVKTGTNLLHGDAWEFFRNQNLDANDYFANQAGLPRPEFHRNQFGGTIGGPVILPKLYDGRNKTFFFADYEGTLIDQGNTMTATVPTNAERASGYLNFSDLIAGQTGTYTDAEKRVFPAGTIFNASTTRQLSAAGIDPLNGNKGTANAYVRDPFPNNVLPTNRVDPNAVKILNLLPMATGAGIVSNYVVTKIFSDSSNSFDVRMDQNFSEKDRFFARYSYNNYHHLHSGPFTGYADGGDAQAEAILNDRAQNVAIGETHIFSSTIVNDFRMGVNREAANWLQPYADTPGINEQFGIQGVPATPGYGGLTKFIVGNLSNFGSASSLPSEKYGTTPQINDDLTFVHGQHAMKFGFEVQRIIVPYLQPPNARGVFNYNGLFTSVVGQKDASTAVAMMLLKPTATDPLSAPRIQSYPMPNGATLFAVITRVIFRTTGNRCNTLPSILACDTTTILSRMTATASSPTLFPGRVVLVALTFLRPRQLRFSPPTSLPRWLQRESRRR
jgi:hypothetical protein